MARRACGWWALGTLLCLSGAGAALVAAEPDDAPDAQAPPAGGSKFRSPDDGWFDLSAFLDQKGGFVPVVVPITEPAVGYGAAVGLAFIDKGGGSEGQAGFGRPNITAVAGALTENGTWSVAGADLRQWMGDRLQTRLALPRELADLPVPPLVLQPLVENAIKHGLEPHVGGGRIEISAERTGERVVLRVRDTGAGLSSGADAAGTRFGLEQVRRRLATIYGAAATLDLQPAGGSEGGTDAIVTLPA